MDNRFVRTMIYCGIGVILAGFRFFYLGETACGFLGLVIGIGMVSAGWGFLKQINDSHKRLMNEGFCVDADFDAVEQLAYSTRQDRYLYHRGNYVVKCSWRDPADGAVHFYTSEQIRLYFDPTFELYHRKTLKVYIDMNNPSEYYVDIAFLKELDKTRKQ